MQKKRKKIAILFGGCSTEYEVSLQSAYSVIEHLDTEKYEPVMIGLERVTGKSALRPRRRVQSSGRPVSGERSWFWGTLIRSCSESFWNTDLPRP